MNHEDINIIFRRTLKINKNIILTISIQKKGIYFTINENKRKKFNS